jgi:hypothetical protein
MFYLGYLYLFVYIGVQHIFAVLSFVCLRFVSYMYPILPVSLDCHFLIAPSVFSNVYLYIYMSCPNSGQFSHPLRI